MTGAGALRLGGLAAATAERLLARAGASVPTYDHVGSTLPSEAVAEPTASPTARPRGRRVRVHRLVLGHGPQTFAGAVEGLRAWFEHDGIHARVVPVRPPIEVGTSLLVVLRVGPIHLAVPDRIVAVVDEPDQFGFAYGTLPGHPERGEESFVVDRAPDGQVTLTIRIDAEPAWPILRLFSPVLDWLQDQAARRYLRAVAEQVRIAGRQPVDQEER